MAEPVVSTTNRQVVLRRRPEGLPVAEDFEVVEAPMYELDEDEALVATTHLSIDATIRTWISDARSYFPPVELGEVVRCSGVGAVVASRCATLPVGTVLTTLNGWQTHCVVRDDIFVTKVEGDTPPIKVLSVFGGTGMAAYHGLVDIGRPEPGQTVVVSGAAGATGSLVGQIAEILGCRAVGVAGTDDKCRWVVSELGFDACVNHRSDTFVQDLRAATPDRIHVYFDNVGGRVLDAALGRLAMGARVVLCGAISVYNDEHRPPGPANYLELITARGRMEGFNTFDYWGRFDDTMAQLRTWVTEGRIVTHETVVEGLERCPDALAMLFAGDNLGKLVVQL